MNGSRSLGALALLAGLLICPVLAQGPSTRPKAPATQDAVAVPVSKVAVIYSEEFQDPKTGIARFNTLLNKLNGEFQPRQTELDHMAQKIKQLQDEITSLQQQAAKGTPVDPKIIQTKIDQLDQLKKEFQRKGEDAQASVQQRRQDLFAPLQDDVGKAVDAYAKAHGITMIIDGSQVPLLYAAESIIITRSFINDYNSKNPATASVTTPK